MIPYILHVALLISVCLCFYKLFLQKETFYKLNRYILTGCLALSFLIPLVPVPQQWSFSKPPETVAVNTTPGNTNSNLSNLSAMQPEKQNSIPSGTSTNTTSQVSTSGTISWATIIKWIFIAYWIGVIVFALNFLLQLIVLLYQAWTKPVIKDGRFRIIELDGDKAPCSFAHYIFINPSKYDWETYNQVLLHEKIHIQQGHSFDIVLAELVKVFQWFNPFAWVYRRALENNLEFLTDHAALHHDGVEKESYQMSLLKVSVPHYSLALTTNYNQSLLKKRIAMMNAKKSNFNTMWKYFFLVPLIGCLMCALNNTVAFGQTGKSDAASQKNHNRRGSMSDRTSGSWFATIKNDKVRMEFKSNDDNENWNSNSDFLLSEFSGIPRDKAGEFTLTREAGTILFKGKFEGDKGFGDYKFTANADFMDNLKKEGITDIQEEDPFVFFMINLKKDYVKMLHANGYKDLTKNELIPLAALKVDEPFIQMWKQNGFGDISSNDLVATKALGIDKAYITDIKKAGYDNISVSQLISFKAQHISGDYINSLRKAKIGNGKNNEEGKLPDANEISAFKAMDISPEFIKSFETIGYKNIEYSDLTAMKATGVTAEYIKSFELAGYSNEPVHQYISLKSLKVTPEFIKGFQSVGINHISLSEITSVKAIGITPEYIKGFQAMGFKSDDINHYVPLKSLGITPEYIEGFKKLGFNNISLEELPGLKAMGITPEFIDSMQAKGIKLKSLEKYIQLKSAMN
jgi:beta-lactamase regulating signal transducer with metallopeptidase domain